MSEKA